MCEGVNAKTQREEKRKGIKKETSTAENADADTDAAASADTESGAHPPEMFGFDRR